MLPLLPKFIWLKIYFSVSDDSKFGKKLLEKMGWAEGKGLGATNQGIIDPITLKSKDDNKVLKFLTLK